MYPQLNSWFYIFFRANLYYIFCKKLISINRHCSYSHVPLATLRGQVQTTTNPKPSKSETRYTPSQASQAPSFPLNPPQQHVQQKLVSNNNNVVPAPTSFPGFKANQPPQAPVQMMQHAPMQLKGAPFKEPSQQVSFSYLFLYISDIFLHFFKFAIIFTCENPHACIFRFSI